MSRSKEERGGRAGCAENPAKQEQGGRQIFYEERQQEYFRILEAIGTAFYSICMLDLETGIYYFIKQEEKKNPDGQKGYCYEDRVRRFLSEKVHPQHREQVEEFLDIGHIRAAMKGQDYLEQDFLRKTGENYEWVRLKLIKEMEGSRVGRNVVFAFQNIDKEHRKKREQELANVRFGSNITESYDIIYELDPEANEIYRVTFDLDGLHKKGMAQPYTQFFEWAVETLIVPADRSLFTDMFHPNRVMAKLSAEKGQAYIEVRRKNQEEYQWFSYLLQELEWKNKISYMIYVKNIDALRKEEEKKSEVLQDALRSAQEANRSKSDFLARMSHDIRTPLNAVMGMTAIAQQHLKEPGQVEACLQKIEIASAHLLGLINDILDMSRIESGKLVLAQDEFRLEDFVEELRAIVGTQADKRRQVLQIRISGLSHHKIVGDRLRLRQIFVNLMTNAVKFTPEGGTVRLELREQKAKYARYASFEFLVQDNGMGMEEELVSRVFEPFVRGGDSMTARTEGTGLGLAITKNLVDMMNGTIHVTSRPGAGTTFVLSLDFKIPDSPEGAPELQAQAVIPGNFEVSWREIEGSMAGKHFLVAEDNDLNREIAVALLSRTGAAVEEAADGAEAVERFEKSPEGWYQLIFMDIQMPVLNGYEAVKRIRALKRRDASAVPIVAMTANAYRSDVEAALDAGMNEHLAKPVEIGALLRVVLTHAGKS